MDKQPKRRKYKDNPYKLEKLEENQIYKVSFKDNQGEKQSVVITSEIYKTFNQFELDDLKELNEFDRHIEHFEQTDETLYNRATMKHQKIDETVENNILLDKLKQAINQLSEVQKRRVKMYYFNDMTLEEIAKKDNCSKVAVKHSLDDAINNLKKFLKN